ncbi:hypothetical protein J1605_008968 [Eschrichtius robustus]|uniref:Uncharacterized protein n=1 Tax=Eschrichtius robustus TaxID=9764 RepID=A0AB34GZ54_ESCRO|nr:hypothetical protein J1605_008968 [Eschrichtius robustus]
MKIITAALVCLLLAGAWLQAVGAKSRTQSSLRNGCKPFLRFSSSACASLQLLFHIGGEKDVPAENPVLQEHQLHLLLQKPSNVSGCKSSEPPYLGSPSALLTCEIEAERRPRGLCLTDKIMGSGLFKKDKPLPVKGNMS